MYSFILLHVFIVFIAFCTKCIVFEQPYNRVVSQLLPPYTIYCVGCLLFFKDIVSLSVISKMYLEKGVIFLFLLL